MENFEPIDFEKIEKGMYIKYRTKAFTYQDGKEAKPALRAGGYVSFVNAEDGFIGLTNYGKNWSVQRKNVSEFYVSTVKKQRLTKDDADATEPKKRAPRRAQSKST